LVESIKFSILLVFDITLNASLFLVRDLSQILSETCFFIVHNIAIKMYFRTSVVFETIKTATHFKEHQIEQIL
jgi:hypothetical protein